MRDGAPNRFGSERKRAARPFHTEDLTLYGKEQDSNARRVLAAVYARVNEDNPKESGDSSKSE